MMMMILSLGTPPPPNTTHSSETPRSAHTGHGTLRYCRALSAPRSLQVLAADAPSAMPNAHWHVPRSIKALDTRRKIRTTLMERVERLVRGNVIPRPVWYDAALAHPPPQKGLKLDRPQKLAFPEDELRREWLRRNPAATMVPKALFLEEASVPEALREHPGDTFVSRQMQLINDGMKPDEAFRTVKAEQEREGDVHELEDRTARKIAAALGAAPADEGESGRMRQQQQLLRRFAEEARDMGLPYPKHWFDAAGAWKGIGGESLRASLAANTKRALERSAPMGGRNAGNSSKDGDDILLSMLDKNYGSGGSK